MDTETTTTDSLKSLRSYCAALDARYQALSKVQQRQNELLETLLKGQAESAKHMRGLEETCRKLASEHQESHRQSIAEKTQLTTTIRRLVANLEARSRKSGKATTKP
jgi:hypothetical protein